MSFFGMGRPKLSSDEKIAMAEQEMRLLADMHNRYVTIDNPLSWGTSFRSIQAFSNLRAKRTHRG